MRQSLPHSAYIRRMLNAENLNMSPEPGIILEIGLTIDRNSAKKRQGEICL